MQGEQGALICAAKIVTQVPDVDSKFYASTQVIDEARHVESYKRLLEKFGVAYPMTAPLQELIDQVLRDSRWDMTYLGMQVVIEGLALAAFQQIRDHAQNPLAAAVNAYVMQDESRHVAFGRLALRDYYPQLTQKERDEREEFLLEACYLMRDRFDAVEVWKTLGLDPVKLRRAHVRQRLHGDVPLVAVHPHRADREGHRDVGQDHPRRLRGHGHHRPCPDRRAGPAGIRRHHRQGFRRPQSLRRQRRRPRRGPGAGVRPGPFPSLLLHHLRRLWRTMNAARRRLFRRECR
jgi:hypothetical protein